MRQIRLILKNGIELLRGFFREQAGTHASSTAFFFFMAFIPLAILYASLVPLLGVSAGDVIDFFQKIVPDAADDLVSRMIAEAYENSLPALSLSAMFLLITTMQGMKALIRGFNQMYGVKERRRFAALNGTALANVAALIVFMTGVIYFIFGGRILRALRAVIPNFNLPGGSLNLLNFLGMLLAGTLFFAFEYKILPSGKRKYAAQLPGGFFASAGWFVLIIGFRIYVSYFNSITRFYGSLASIALFLFWLYIVFFILFGGAYINRRLGSFLPASLHRFWRMHRRRAILAIALILLGFVAYLSGGFVSWRLQGPEVDPLLTVCRLATWGCWIGALLLVLRTLRRRMPPQFIAPLAVLMVLDFFVLRRLLGGNVLIYLVALTFVYLAALLVLSAAYLCGE